jgi:hypothetical protein
LAVRVEAAGIDIEKLHTEATDMLADLRSKH